MTSQNEVGAKEIFKYGRCNKCHHLMAEDWPNWHRSGKMSNQRQWTTETQWSGSEGPTVLFQHSGAGCSTTTCCFKTLLMRILMWCHAHTWHNHRLHHVVVRWSVICVSATLFALSNTVTIIVTHTNWMKQYCHVVGGYMSAKHKTDHLLKRFQMNDYMHWNTFTFILVELWQLWAAETRLQQTAVKVEVLTRRVSTCKMKANNRWKRSS